LDTAANLIHVPSDAVRRDDRQNTRAAAAALAHEARQLHHGSLPNSINDWAGALAQYSGAIDLQTAQEFADDVFSTMQRGASRTTSRGQQLDLVALPAATPSRSTTGTVSPSTRAGGQSSPECPSTLNCRFVPAAYAQNDPNDLTSYGNYDIAQRPRDLKVDYIVIHDTEVSYDAAISYFQDPSALASAHYVIRSSDGGITQMVRNSDIAYGAGDWYINMHSINIEHEGFAAQGATWFTESQYRSSAALVRFLAQRYHVPLDRAHIIGHDNVPTRTPEMLKDQHWDPGPYWNWAHYMALLHGEADDGATAGGVTAGPGGVVTIAPAFAKNRPPVTDCTSGTCAALPAQPANLVYLHAQPSVLAPLITDLALHPDGSPGTTAINDWSASASTGERYVRAGQYNDWTGIWFSGQIGWLYNPHGAGRTAQMGSGAMITVRPGLAHIPVYGAAFPEASAYPSVIPVKQITPLQYTIGAGEHYVTSGGVPTDYFYADTINLSAPADHSVVRGDDRYLQISFNHREFFVKTDDVVVDGYGGL
jgi:N-acetyl-anhydromuramyl-L-alanine amidase AmpD